MRVPSSYWDNQQEVTLLVSPVCASFIILFSGSTSEVVIPVTTIGYDSVTQKIKQQIRGCDENLNQYNLFQNTNTEAEDLPYY